MVLRGDVYLLLTIITYDFPTHSSEWGKFMRYAAIFVDSVSQWAVMDTLSDGFVPEFFGTEREARKAAELEENRWDELMADALPHRAGRHKAS